MLEKKPTGSIDPVADLSLRHDEVISCVFMGEERFKHRHGPLRRNGCWREPSPTSQHVVGKLVTPFKGTPRLLDGVDAHHQYVDVSCPRLAHHHL
jgi:hypothetical protein